MLQYFETVIISTVSIILILKTMKMLLYIVQIKSKEKNLRKDR